MSSLKAYNLGSLLNKIASSESDSNDLESRFSPSYTPEQLKELGIYSRVYEGGEKPYGASLQKWPEKWLDKQDPLGWLQWYERYSQGRRSDTDEKQIKRWLNFLSRHGGPFKEKPTPRRGEALQNWSIDPQSLLTKDKLEEYLSKLNNK